MLELILVFLAAFFLIPVVFQIFGTYNEWVDIKFDNWRERRYRKWNGIES